MEISRIVEIRKAITEVWEQEVSGPGWTPMQTEYPAMDEFTAALGAEYMEFLEAEELAQERGEIGSRTEEEIQGWYAALERSNAEELAIIEIAIASAKICDQNGYGHQVVVWPDLSWSEANGANDLVARSNGEVVERPLGRLRVPHTIQALQALRRERNTTWN